MQPLMPCTRPDFNGALFNFRIFLKLEAPTGWGPGQVAQPLPPPLGGPGVRYRLFAHRHHARHLGSVARKVNSAIHWIMIFQLRQKGVKTMDTELARDEK